MNTQKKVDSVFANQSHLWRLAPLKWSYLTAKIKFLDVKKNALNCWCLHIFPSYVMCARSIFKSQDGCFDSQFPRSNIPFKTKGPSRKLYHWICLMRCEWLQCVCLLAWMSNRRRARSTCAQYKTLPCQSRTVAFACWVGALIQVLFIHSLLWLSTHRRNGARLINQ